MSRQPSQHQRPGNFATIESSNWKGAAKPTRLLNIPLTFAVLFASFTSVGAQEAEARLDRFFQDYLEVYFRQQPLQATRLGDHRFDHLLEDLSPRARQDWTAHARSTLKELPKQVDYAKLSRAGQIDFEIFKHNLETTLWLAENTHPFEEDPRVYGEYINDSIFLLLTQSTRPKETNMANCLARM